MQWSDVITPPSSKTLRQFSGLLVIFAAGIAALRWYQGRLGPITEVLAVAGVVVGLIGLVQPAVVRYVYSGWMIAAFPIGWTVSRLMLGVIFFGIFTPVSAVFKVIGRDALRLRRRTAASYWVEKPRPVKVDEYFRQY